MTTFATYHQQQQQHDSNASASAGHKRPRNNDTDLDVHVYVVIEPKRPVNNRKIPADDPGIVVSRLRRVTNRRSGVEEARLEQKRRLIATGQQLDHIQTAEQVVEELAVLGQTVACVATRFVPSDSSNDAALIFAVARIEHKVSPAQSDRITISALTTSWDDAEQRRNQSALDELRRLESSGGVNVVGVAAVAAMEQRHRVSHAVLVLDE